MERNFEHLEAKGAEPASESVDAVGLLEQEQLKLCELIEGQNERGKSDAKNRLFAKARAYLLVTLMALGVAGEGRLAFGQSKDASTVEHKEQPNHAQSKKLAYEYINRVVEANQLKQVVEYLDEVYADEPEVKEFLSYSKVREAIEQCEVINVRVAEGDSSELVDGPYMNRGGVLRMLYESRGWAPRTKEERVDGSKPFVVSGFDTLGVNGNGEIKQALEGRYSPFWLGNSTREISFRQNDSVVVGPDGRYVILGLDEAKVRLAELMTDDPRAAITIYPSTLEMAGESPRASLKDKVIDVLNHEIGHSNDWEGSKILSAPERISFLAEVTKRYLSGNKFFSRYVESDVASLAYRDSYEQLYSCVREYWAELTRNYFGDRQKEFIAQHPDDAALVAKWYDKAVH